MAISIIERSSAFIAVVVDFNEPKVQKCENDIRNNFDGKRFGYPYDSKLDNLACNK